MANQEWTSDEFRQEFMKTFGPAKGTELWERDKQNWADITVLDNKLEYYEEGSTPAVEKAIKEREHQLQKYITKVRQPLRSKTNELRRRRDYGQLSEQLKQLQEDLDRLSKDKPLINRPPPPQQSTDHAILTVLSSNLEELTNVLRPYRRRLRLHRLLSMTVHLAVFFGVLTISKDYALDFIHPIAGRLVVAGVLWFLEEYFIGPVVHMLLDKWKGDTLKKALWDLYKAEYKGLYMGALIEHHLPDTGQQP